MLKLYNTFTKSLENLESTDSDIKIYLCGPTVQSSPHIGHGRSAVVFDFMVRYIKYSGMNVIFARNITDIDDKIIEKSIEENISYKELGDRVTKEFKDSYDKLNCLTPDFEPKATETIDQMIDLIDDLIRKDYAYVTKSGVYFDVSKYDSYLELSGRSFDEVLSGTRVNIEEDKKNSEDFALWKISKENEPSWKSPWGNGRPGWHIECSAMIHDIFKGEIDIHCGGNDLIFPHHENEIAQSRCANDTKAFANYWVHNAFITMSNEKMAKSQGNILKIKDFRKKMSGQVIRLALMSAHYKQPLDWNGKLINDCQNTLDKWYRIYSSKIKKVDIPENVLKPLYEDLNTPGYIANLHQLYDKANKGEDLDIFISACKFIGLFNEDSKQWDSFKKNKASISEEEIKKMIDLRNKARENKNYKEADEIRNKLLDKGVLIEDKDDKTLWKFK